MVRVQSKSTTSQLVSLMATACELELLCLTIDQPLRSNGLEAACRAQVSCLLAFCKELVTLT